MKRAWKLDASADPLLDFLLRGSFASFATRVAGVALSYGSAVLLSRTLEVSGYGVYSVALGWALVLVLPSRAGLDYAALRFGSAYLEEGAIERLRGFFRFSASVVFGASVVAGAALYLVTGLGLTGIRPSMAPGVGLLIFPIAALGLAGALLRTARKIAAGQFYDQILRPAGLIAGLAAAALAGLRLSPADAMEFSPLSARLSRWPSRSSTWRARLGPCRAWRTTGRGELVGAELSVAAHQRGPGAAEPARHHTARTDEIRAARKAHAAELQHHHQYSKAGIAFAECILHIAVVQESKHRPVSRPIRTNLPAQPDEQRQQAHRSDKQETSSSVALFTMPE